MIDIFFKQTNDTIRDFLAKIGKNKDVFSSVSGMEIEGYQVYFYATKTEIVLMCVDYGFVEDGTVEYADKSLRSPKSGKLTTCFRKVRPDGTISKKENDLRYSPAMLLYNHACRMRKFLALSCQFDIVPPIHMMLLTNTHIINYKSAVRAWQQDLFGLTVLHNLSGLKELTFEGIPVNEDLSLESSAYWTKWQTYLRNRGWFDWADWRFDDWPPPAVKRYPWKPQKGHLISEEFEEEEAGPWWLKGL